MNILWMSIKNYFFVIATVTQQIFFWFTEYYDEPTYNTCWTFSVSDATLCTLHTFHLCFHCMWVNRGREVTEQIIKVTWWTRYLPHILTVKGKHFKPFLVFWEDRIALCIPDWVRTLSDLVESAFIELVIQVGTATPNTEQESLRKRWWPVSSASLKLLECHNPALGARDQVFSTWSYERIFHIQES